MTQRSGRPLIVALDVGTSSTRALLYDASGRLQPGREAQIKYEQRLTADGGVETDPDRLLADTLRALRALLDSCDAEQRGRIAAVGASNFWHALMGVDASGRPVTPLLSWADTRSASETPGLIAAGLDPEAYHVRTGAFVHSCYWPAKIAWIRRTRPKTYEAVARWVSFGDYMAMQLCGSPVTSVSLASGTGLFNQDACVWDAPTLSVLGIDTSRLPELPVGDGSFRPDNRRLTGDLPDAPWFPAYGDGACSNLGSGGVDDRRLVINLGTSGAVRTLTRARPAQLARGLFCYRLDGERRVVGGAVSNGGNVYAWLQGALRVEPAFALEKQLQRAAPDAHGLTVLPFWAGERSPGWHAHATAAILGLNLSTSPLAITQASMEAVAYTIRGIRMDLLGSCPAASETIVSGGAIEHSRYMVQLFANALEAPVRRSLDPEPSARGAALAVAARIGALPGIEAAPDRLSRPIEPDPAASQAYRAGYDRFRRAYDSILAGDAAS